MDEVAIIVSLDDSSFRFLGGDNEVFGGFCSGLSDVSDYCEDMSF